MTKTPAEMKALMLELYRPVEAFAKERDLGPFELITLLGMLTQAIWEHLQVQQRERFQNRIRNN